jgi:hypothetical protein
MRGKKGKREKGEKGKDTAIAISVQPSNQKKLFLFFPLSLFPSYPSSDFRPLTQIPKKSRQ